MLSTELERAIRQALEDATRRRHEFSGLEHLLLALLDDDKTADVIKHCGGSLGRLRDKLERFLDKDAVELMAKITLREDPEFTKQYPEKWNCRLVAETFAGARHEVHVAYPKGHPENPFSDDQVEEKFLRLAKPRLETAAVGSSSIGHGGWSEPKMSASFFRCWRFHEGIE